MKDVCIVAGCTRLRRGKGTYCLRCLRVMGDIAVPITKSVDPKDRIYEFVATCGNCSRDQYGIMLTRDKARLVLRSGRLVCGHCRHTDIQLEELALGNRANTTQIVEGATQPV